MEKKSTLRSVETAGPLSIRQKLQTTSYPESIAKNYERLEAAMNQLSEQVLQALLPSAKETLQSQHKAAGQVKEIGRELLPKIEPEADTGKVVTFLTMIQNKAQAALDLITKNRDPLLDRLAKTEATVPSVLGQFDYLYNPRTSLEEKLNRGFFISPELRSEQDKLREQFLQSVLEPMSQWEEKMGRKDVLTAALQQLTAVPDNKADLGHLLDVVSDILTFYTSAENTAVGLSPAKQTLLNEIAGKMNNFFTSDEIAAARLEIKDVNQWLMEMECFFGYEEAQALLAKYLNTVGFEEGKIRLLLDKKVARLSAQEKEWIIEVQHVVRAERKAEEERRKAIQAQAAKKEEGIQKIFQELPDDPQELVNYTIRQPEIVDFGTAALAKKLSDKFPQLFPRNLALKMATGRGIRTEHLTKDRQRALAEVIYEIVNANK